MADAGKVAVIGAGTMGHGIAQCFGLKGWRARVFDTDPDALAGVHKKVEANLETFVSLGLATSEQASACLENIETRSDLESTVRGADLVIEAVSEKLELKRGIFAQLESMTEPGAILATNTSAINISLIAEKLERPERVVGTHFWNPPHVLPCVEVIKSRFTSDHVFERTVDILASIGKEPVRVLKDLPGFLGNRMQHALQREAMSLVDNGVASPEDVDRVVKYGFGLRLALMGPLERADLGGLDITLRVQDYLLQFLESSITPSAQLQGMVDKGELGAKTGKGYYEWPPEKLKKTIKERDQKLLKLIALATG